MIRVLLADDHQIMRHGLRDLLTTQLGAEVRVGEAQNAGEAISLLLQDAWDLVLLDISMPGRSGLEVLEESRRLQPKTPVLMLSSYPEEQFALRAFKLGAAGYLSKGSASDELIIAVRRILAGGKYVTVSLAERLATSVGVTEGQVPHEALSARELQVLILVAQGRAMKEIADELGLSEKTVATYRSRISEKTGLKTGVEIARYAMKHRLVE